MTIRKDIPVVFEEIKIDAARLSNLAYSKLADMIEEELSDAIPETCNIDEAIFLLELQKALAKKAPYIILKVTYPEKEESK